MKIVYPLRIQKSLLMTHCQYFLVVGLNSVYPSVQISAIKLQKQNKPMKTRILTILFLLLMSVASFLPFPTTTLICLYAAIFRPHWLKKVVDEVYKSKKPMIITQG